MEQVNLNNKVFLTIFSYDFFYSIYLADFNWKTNSWVAPVE